MVEYGIHGDGGLTRLPVADDEFALPPAYGDHAVYGENARLQRLIYLCPVHDGGRGKFYGARFARMDIAQPVERAAERIDDPAEHLFTHLHFQRFSRGIDVVAETDLVFARKKDGTDAVVLQIERERLVTAPHVEQFVVLHVGKPRYFYDAVARIDDPARRALAVIFGSAGDLFFQAAAYIVQI